MVVLNTEVIIAEILKTNFKNASKKEKLKENKAKC